MCHCSGRLVAILDKTTAYKQRMYTWSIRFHVASVLLFIISFSYATKVITHCVALIHEKMHLI